MKVRERRQKILEMIQEGETISLKELARRLDTVQYKVQGDMKYLREVGAVVSMQVTGSLIVKVDKTFVVPKQKPRGAITNYRLGYRKYGEDVRSKIEEEWRKGTPRKEIARLTGLPSAGAVGKVAESMNLPVHPSLTQRRGAHG